MVAGASPARGTRPRSPPKAERPGDRAIIAAYEAGYTLFDNADIYCARRSGANPGRSAERSFGDARAGADHDQMRHSSGGNTAPAAPQRYDFSAEHITESCEQSLKRLGIETSSIFTCFTGRITWPIPRKLRGRFSQLRSSGKVRYFGISNFRPTLVTALAGGLPDAAGRAPGRDQPGANWTPSPTALWINA